MTLIYANKMLIRKAYNQLNSPSKKTIHLSAKYINFNLTVIPSQIVISPQNLK